MAWLKMLKTSTRNCTLNASEMRATCVFFTRDISKLTILGPITLLRPALPRRFAQYTCPLGGGAAAPGKLTHCAAREAGAVGGEKQFVLR